MIKKRQDYKVLYPRKIAASLAIHFNPNDRTKWPPVIYTVAEELADGQRRLDLIDQLIKHRSM